MPEIQRLIKSSVKFDLVITEFFYVDVFFAFGYKFDAPIIALSPQDLLPYYSWISGNPFPSSYVPSIFLPFTEKMSFIERLANSAFNFLAGKLMPLGGVHIRFLSTNAESQKSNLG